MITGIIGFNKVGTSTNILLAGYGNDVMNVATGSGYGLAINPDYSPEFEVFLDRTFFQNYYDRPKTFDGTTWTTKNVARCMRSKYIQNVKSHARLYLGNCKFTSPQIPLDTAGNEVTFPSRVFYSDLYYGAELTWGMEWGTNGKVTNGSAFFELDQPLAQDFVASNIKIGDPLIVTSGGTNLVGKEFRVKSVVSPYRLEMTETFTETSTSLNFYVGSNWFDVGVDNNDEIKGLDERGTTLLIFKLFSVSYYTGTSLKPVPNSVGTSSNRSIISAKTGTYFFHGSDPLITGIYRFDGSNVTKVSRAIDPYINGLSTSDYNSPVGWKEGEELRWYLGTLSNTDRGISMNHGVVTYHSAVGAWDVGPIADKITCSTTFIFGNENSSFCGNDNGQVLKMAEGYTFNGEPIPFKLETKVYYPMDTEIICELPRIQIIGRNTRGIKVKYKLWDMPKTVDDNWLPLSELSNDKTELVIPTMHKLASGVQLRFDGMDTLENDPYVEKVSFFYKPNRSRML